MNKDAGQEKIKIVTTKDQFGSELGSLGAYCNRALLKGRTIESIVKTAKKNGFGYCTFEIVKEHIEWLSLRRGDYEIEKEIVKHQPSEKEIFEEQLEELRKGKRNFVIRRSGSYNEKMYVMSGDEVVEVDSISVEKREKLVKTLDRLTELGNEIKTWLVDSGTTYLPVDCNFFKLGKELYKLSVVLECYGKTMQKTAKDWEEEDE